MSSDTGVFKGLIKAYKDSKIAIIQKLAETNECAIESLFLDDGYIDTKINRLKKEYGLIEDQIQSLIKYDTKEDTRKTQKLNYLKSRQVDIYVEIAILASNRIENIDKCIGLLEGIDIDFILCLQGLKLYGKGMYKEACLKFDQFFREKNALLEHFLINRVYGGLLYKEGRYSESAVFLRKAAEKRPEDLESHRALEEIYKTTGNRVGVSVQRDIISLLEVRR